MWRLDGECGREVDGGEGLGEQVAEGTYGLWKGVMLWRSRMYDRSHDMYTPVRLLGTE